MSAIEAEILERLNKLDDAGKQRVLQFVREIEPKAFDFDDWLQRVKTSQEALRAKYGDDYSVGAQSLLDELREEASYPRF